MTTEQVAICKSCGEPLTFAHKHECRGIQPRTSKEQALASWITTCQWGDLRDAFCAGWDARSAPETKAHLEEIPARDEGETPEEYRRRLQLFGVYVPKPSEAASFDKVLAHSPRRVQEKTSPTLCACDAPYREGYECMHPYNREGVQCRRLAGDVSSRRICAVCAPDGIMATEIDGCMRLNCPHAESQDPRGAE